MGLELRISSVALFYIYKEMEYIRDGVILYRICLEIEPMHALKIPNWMVGVFSKVLIF